MICARLVGTPLENAERKHGDGEAAEGPPDDLGLGDDPRARLARWTHHDAGIGNVDDEADDDRHDDEELAEQQLHREERNAAVEVEDRGETA